MFFYPRYNVEKILVLLCYKMKKKRKQEKKDKKGFQTQNYLN